MVKLVFAPYLRATRLATLPTLFRVRLDPSHPDTQNRRSGLILSYLLRETLVRAFICPFITPLKL
jgi:hypothetical protein